MNKQSALSILLGAVSSSLLSSEITGRLLRPHQFSLDYSVFLTLIISQTFPPKLLEVFGLGPWFALNLLPEAASDSLEQ